METIRQNITRPREMHYSGYSFIIILLKYKK